MPRARIPSAGNERLRRLPALGAIQKAYPAWPWAEVMDRLLRALSVFDQKRPELVAECASFWRLVANTQE
jgi:hypothetical protein